METFTEDQRPYTDERQIIFEETDVVKLYENNELKNGTTISNSQTVVLSSASDIYQYRIGKGIRINNELESSSNTTSSNDCASYPNALQLAKILVNTVIEISESIFNENYSKLSLIQAKDVMAFSSKDYQGFSYIETKNNTVIWPTISEFTVELGAYAIDEYLASFETNEDWIYAIYYQGVLETKMSTLHKYQAIYSLPTWKYPIAQVTASIFFQIEVFNTKPAYCFVDVSYQYENYRLVHRPGLSDFQEKWLQCILETKIKLFQTITY